MASEPMSTRHISLAERFPSFADYAASTASLPQTGATSLDVARFHAFTGEMTFSVDPAVRLYLDGGYVYHAERDGGPAVCRLLLDAGVVDSVQLQRGVVRVGDVEHLGRLFDRDTTVDRDAVLVVVEGASDAIVQEIANSVIATIAISAYRHHPSGIHRWFVAPVEPTAAQRPASGVMQVDRSVVEDLPLLGGPPAPPVPLSTPPDTPAASMVIEWADPDPSSLGPTDATGDAAPGDTDADTDIDFDIQAELDRFDADRADWTAASGGNDPDPSEAVPSPLGEFRIVWPDGTRDESIVTAEGTAPAVSTPVFDDPVVDSPAQPFARLDPPSEPARELSPPELAPPTAPASAPPAASLAAPAAAPDSLPAPSSPPAPSPAIDIPVSHAAAPDSVGFTIEPLQIDRIPEPDAAVPDDVAAAVRRALQAIENATDFSSGASVPQMKIDLVAVPEISTPAPAPAPAPTVAPEPKPEPAAAQPAGAPLGFAPPTVDMRAEALYERAAAEVSADQPVPVEAIVGDVEASHPAPGRASVVFVDEDDDGNRERRGALSRLISSLRSKD